MKKIILLMILTTFFFNCNNKRTIHKKLSSEQKNKIEAALKNLLTRDNSDAFVIITETSSEKFVQFAIHNQKLLFDFPNGQLNDSQLKQCKKLLKQYSIIHEVQKSYDANDKTKIIGEFGTFNKELNDVNSATEIVDIIISNVFNSEEIVLNIEEN